MRKDDKGSQGDSVTFDIVAATSETQMRFELA